MSQKGADGPATSGGHRFGRKAANDAGVPFDWVNRGWSPEQKEHRARQVAEDAKQAQAASEINRLLKEFPDLKRTASRFLHGTHAATAILADGDWKSLVREQRNRRAVLEATKER